MYKCFASGLCYFFNAVKHCFALLCITGHAVVWYMGIPVLPPIDFYTKSYLLKIVDRFLHQTLTPL